MRYAIQCYMRWVLAVGLFFLNLGIGTAASQLDLPAPGTMVALSPSYAPAMLKGIKINPDKPLQLDFILDTGDEAQPTRGHVQDRTTKNVSPSRLPSNEGLSAEATQRQNADALKLEANRLIKYFLASLTIPEKDLWVNLSPYERDRIIADDFGRTDMGRDLLAQDYLLKQLTASLIYPDNAVGRKFWQRVYQNAAQKFGTTNVPVNTFNKVWIVPDKAVVYENAKAGTAYVVESTLKVMLEQDYLAAASNQRQPGDMFKTDQPRTCPQAGCETNKALNLKATEGTNRPRRDDPLNTQILHDLIVPQLTKEVNEGKNFAQLRQVYNALILAAWYKKKIKNSILQKVYVDRQKTKGIDILNPQEEKEHIYARYVQAFKKGAYSLIKEEQDPVTHKNVLRKYFSGGMELSVGERLKVTDQAMTVRAMAARSRSALWRIAVSLMPGKPPSADDMRMARGSRPMEEVVLDNAMAAPLQKLFYSDADFQQTRVLMAAHIQNALKGKVADVNAPSIQEVIDVYTQFAVRRGIEAAYKMFDVSNRLALEISGSRPGNDTVEMFSILGMVVSGTATGRGIDVERLLSRAHLNDRVETVRSMLLRNVGVAFEQSAVRVWPNVAKSLAFRHLGIMALGAHGVNSQLTIYHEALHLLFPGYIDTWMNEAVTQYLTKDAYEAEKESVVFNHEDVQDVAESYNHEQEMLATLAELTGYEPLVLSYFTGDRTFLEESLGENSGFILSLLSSLGPYGDFGSPLIGLIARKRNDLAALEKIKDFLEDSLHDNFDTRQQKATDLINSFGQNIPKLVPQVAHSPELLSKLEQLKTSDNPTLRKNSISWLKRIESRMADRAMLNTVEDKDRAGQAVNGGIDFNQDRLNLEVKDGGSVFKFGADPAMAARLEGVAGFSPVIVDVRPVADLASFLGITP